MKATLGAVYSMLSEEDARTLDQHMTSRAVSAGETLLSEGAVSESLYLLSRGHARVQQEYLGAQVDISEVRTGEMFGEISFLLKTPVTASVVMDCDGEVRMIGARQLAAVAEQSPGLEARLYHSLARILAQRLSKASPVTLPSFQGG